MSKLSTKGAAPMKTQAQQVCEECHEDYQGSAKGKLCMCGGKLIAPMKTPRISIDPPGYADRVRQLEAEGMTTSDAQAVADVEYARAEGTRSSDDDLQGRQGG